MATEKKSDRAVYDCVAPVTAKRKQWEYFTILLGGEPDLNPYGADGWELMFTIDHGFNERIYYFKKPKN